MTNRQESRLKMYLATDDFLVKNESVTKDLPEFLAVFGEFKDGVSQIKLIDEQQKSIRTGIARDKKDLKTAVVALSADNAGKVFALATVTDNKPLMDEVNISISELGRMTDVSLRSYSEALYKKIDTIIDKLEKYGINTETQKAFAEAIGAYNNSIAKPRVSIAEKREATKELEMLFVKTDKVLDKIDAIMNVIRYKEVNFYTGYKTVRKLVGPSAGNVALKAAASDVTTSEPLKGSLFTFRSNGNIIKKKTAETGIFFIRNMKPGQYELVVTKDGYKDKALTVTVNDGERCEVKVELEKI